MIDRRVIFCPWCGRILKKWKEYNYVYECMTCSFPDSVWEIIPIYNENDLPTPISCTPTEARNLVTEPHVPLPAPLQETRYPTCYELFDEHVGPFTRTRYHTCRLPAGHIGEHKCSNFYEGRVCEFQWQKK